ncbi:hypothetical protein BK745_14300 [Bacillus thuringiensis serovar alesti]|nr:hypothetical protein BK745_14300 [Bacillus thuringiensis serovar alesti]
MQRVEMLEKSKNVENVMKNGDAVLKKESVEPKKSVLPMISDTDNIMLFDGEPYKVDFINGQYIKTKIAWEQIPKHRHTELV